MYSRYFSLHSLATVLLLVVFSPVFASPPDPVEESPEVGIPVGPGLYRLYGADPELPTDDLEPLLAMIGSARFVGLGESFHTSGGYYEMKHRVFRYLVDNGFRAFGFETPWVNAEGAKEYVETCQGSSEDALDSLFRVWNCTEVRDLLEWMCDWNQSHPEDPVHFYGFDIQNPDDQNTTPLIEFLEELDYEEVDPIVEGILICHGAASNPNIGYPSFQYEPCREALDAAEQLFNEQERQIVQATSKEALAWARIHLVSAQARQDLLFFWPDVIRSSIARDRGMAYVAAAIPEIRFPRARVALWAHNAHIMKDGTATIREAQTMGHFLNEAFGPLYVSIAITSYEFSLEWPWTSLCGTYAWVGDIALEEILYQTGEQALLVDFTPLGADEGMFVPDTVYYVGGMTMEPAEQFDGLIWMESSPAMDPLFDEESCP